MSRYHLVKRKTSLTLHLTLNPGTEYDPHMETSNTVFGTLDRSKIYYFQTRLLKSITDFSSWSNLKFRVRSAAAWFQKLFCNNCCNCPGMGI